MTTPRDPDALLAAYLADGMEVLPDRVVDAVLDEVHRTRQRVVFGRWRARSMIRPALGAAAVFAVLVLGGMLLLAQRGQPAVVGGPSQTPELTARPSEVAPSPSLIPSPVATSRPAAVIAYINFVDRANKMGPTPRVWIVGADGGGGHELFPGGIGGQTGVVWSPDGTRLIFSGVSPGDANPERSTVDTLYMTDASGSEPQLVDAGCAACSNTEAAFSSDGTKLVFMRNGTIATMDLATGRVVELSVPATVWPEEPRWSPDGKQIVFSHFDKLRGGSAVFMVDADGQNLRPLSSATLPARLPEWSPDGSRIVFTSHVVKIVRVGGDNVMDVYQDVYTVRPDWTDLRRLTTEGFSSGATWTPDGRIMFTRECTVERPSAIGSDPADCSASGLWTMDADGGNAQLLVPGAYGKAAWQPTP